MLQGDPAGYAVAQGMLYVADHLVNWQVDHNPASGEWQVTVWVCGNIYGPSPYVDSTTTLEQLLVIVRQLAREYITNEPDLFK